METTQELAWLRFNRRVLDQTRRPDFPVLERLRFLGIWASNLDEFFAARVWRLFLEGRETGAYREVLREAQAQADLAARAYDAFLFDLGTLGVRILSMAELTLRSQLRDDVNAYELRADVGEERHWAGSHDCQRLDGYPRSEPRSPPRESAWAGQTIAAPSSSSGRS